MSNIETIRNEYKSAIACIDCLEDIGRDHGWTPRLEEAHAKAKAAKERLANELLRYDPDVIETLAEIARDYDREFNALVAAGAIKYN